MGLATGQMPDQPGIDGAKCQFAGARHGTRTRHVGQNPVQFGAGKIGVEHQTGLAREQRLAARGPELIAVRGGAPVLPDNGVMDRRAGRAIPHHRRFALIGNAYGGDFTRR